MGIHNTVASMAARMLIGMSTCALAPSHAEPAKQESIRAADLVSGPVAPADPAGRLPVLQSSQDNAPLQALSYRPADIGHTESWVSDSGDRASSMVEVRTSRKDESEAAIVSPSSGSDAFVVHRRERRDDGSLQVESAVGDQMLNNNPVVGSGRRIALPSTTMRGISSSGANPDSQLNWSLGKTGRLEGAGEKSFVADGASVAGIGLNHDFVDSWRFGAQFWTLKGSDGVMDPSMATAIEFTPDARGHDARYALRTLVDDPDRWGVMFDGELGFDRIRHETGLFRIEPDAKWAGQSLTSDAQGAYWHSSLALDHRTLTAGVEAEARNIRRDESRDALNVTSVYSGFSEDLPGSVSLSGNVRSEFQRRVAGLPGTDRDVHRLELSLDRASAPGPARLALSWQGDYGGAESEESVRLSWQQNWLESTTTTLRSRIDLDRKNRPQGASYQPAASVEMSRRLPLDAVIRAVAFYTPESRVSLTDPFPESGCAMDGDCPHGTGTSIWLALNRDW